MAPAPARPLTIGALARAGGVRVSTVRFYERKRLLQPARRSAGRYRLYGPGDVQRVRFVKRAQALGFSLADIALLLQLSGRADVRRADLQRVGQRKLEELDQRLEALGRVRRGLEQLLAQPCFDPAAPCPVLSALDEPRSPLAGTA